MVERTYQINPREIIKKRLKEDLGEAKEIDVRSAILCGEMGCEKIVQDFISQHPNLRCPYEGRVDDPKAYCERLRKEYQAAIADSDYKEAKSMDILEYMGKDHDRLENIFEEFRDIIDRDITKARSLFHDFKIGLQRHIVWEEEILFPIFENKTGMYDTGPTAVMRMEHRKIKGFLEKIHDKVVKGDNKVEILENGLIEVLTEHNNKEENILYPWIDKETNEQEREEAFTKMKNLPADKYNLCCE